MKALGASVSKISKTLFASILSPLTENWRKQKCFVFTKINGLFTQRSNTQMTMGKIKVPSHTSPELTFCHLVDKTFTVHWPGTLSCMWPIQDEGQEIRPIQSRDIKSNRSYTKGQVPVFLQDTGTRRLLIKKTRFISGTTFLFFCFVLKSVKETGS